jgi:DedD protein
VKEENMKRERLIILIGTLVAIIFFYLGFNTWLKNKEEKITPPPVVVKPQPKEVPEQTQPTAPTEKPQETKTVEQKQKVEEKKEVQKEQEKTVEKRIKEEKKKEQTVKKTYIVQVGAFSNMENAQKALKKAKSLGYKGVIVEEGGLYKVRLKVITADIKKDLGPLKSHFGSVLIKR